MGSWGEGQHAVGLASTGNDFPGGGGCSLPLVLGPSVPTPLILKPRSNFVDVLPSYWSGPEVTQEVVSVQRIVPEYLRRLLKSPQRQMCRLEVPPDGRSLHFRSSPLWRRTARPRRCSWAIGCNRSQRPWRTRSRISRDPASPAAASAPPGQPWNLEGETTFLDACSA